MKSVFILLAIALVLTEPLKSQTEQDEKARILFHGLVLDAFDLTPVPNTQILINNFFTSVSESDGSFSFYVYRNDTVLFINLGFKSTTLNVSDTLSGNEFLAGVYLNRDTVAIGEVIILPRLTNLKSEIMNGRNMTPSIMENAKYNVAISAYQGRTTQNRLGDPANNYEVLRQQQKNEAFEKGGIPSDKIIGLSPLMLIPAASLLINGLPEKPPPFKQQITDIEIDQLNKRYFEKIRGKDYQSERSID